MWSHARRVLALALYSVLLLVSHRVRARSDRSPVLSADEHAINVPVSGHSADPQNTIRLVYVRVGDCSVSTPVLLIHGSPGSKRDLESLVPVLSRNRCVLIPDLPGFGASEHHLPNYSFRAHAEYLTSMLHQLGVNRLHVVGYSMGGGVALNLLELNRDRVTSLTLLSSIGVQEWELFGHYRINHALHAVLLAGIWLAREAIPHFGWLDDSPFDVSFARNFFDSDQRLLRHILQTIDVPTLIVHGRADSAVPLEAAVEHHRVVPQSELQMLDGDHMMIFREGATVAGIIADFLTRVDAHRARSRAAAEPARLAAAFLSPESRIVPPLRGLVLVVFSVTLVTVVMSVTGLAELWRRRRVRRPQ